MKAIRKHISFAVFLILLITQPGCKLKSGDSEILTDASATSETSASTVSDPASDPAPTADPSPTPSSSVPAIIPGGKFNGTVRDAVSGVGMAGVTVEIVPEGSSSPLETLTTDVSGNYSSSAEPAGNYVLNFLKTGYIESGNNPGTIATTQNVTINSNLSATLGAGQFRIVLTWTAAKAGAVQDIDSYLSVPGDAQRKHWNRAYFAKP